LRILMGMPEIGARGGPPACEPPFAQQLRAMGVEVEEEIYARAAAERGWAGRVARVGETATRFRRQVRTGRFDVVHINTSFDARALVRDAFVVSRLGPSRAKIFLKLHGSDARLVETRNPVWSLLRRRLFAGVAAMGVLSSEERGNFLRAGVPEEKIFRVANIVGKSPCESREDFLRRWNLPADRPLLLFIGRFIPAKGLLDVIRACRLLRERGQEFLLLCVGDGPARGHAEAEAGRCGLRERVRFLGYLREDQAADFYAHSTALVFPTYHYEGFPLAIFHAAAAGLPILTTRIRAAADYLKEPDNCLWVEPKEPGPLAGRIVEILGSAELRAEMSANNRRLVERFSESRVTQEYVDIYERLGGRAV
jgi:glycosyltransferase involved in cell wall biosynthesis